MASAPPRLRFVPFGDITVTLPQQNVLRAPALRHELNNLCTHCNAWTWAEEHMNCCSNGKYVVEPLIPLPAEISQLFQTKHFLENQRRYNGLFSFTAMGADPSPTWTQPSYPSMLQLHGRAYHRIMDGFRTNYSERTPVVNKARMYMYDAELLRHAQNQRSLDPSVVAAVSSSLNTHNSWIKSYRSVLLEIDRSNNTDNVGIEFAQVTRREDGPVIGDAPPTSGKETAALIFKDDPATRSRRFVYTFPRCGPEDACTRPRFVPTWSPMYSLQCPLLLFHGEPVWSPGWSTEDPPKKSQTLSITTGKPVKIWTLVRQRLLSEKVFTYSLSLRKSMPATLIPVKRKTF